MQSIRKEVLDLKKELDEVKLEQEESIAMSMLRDYKKQNKRMFVILLVVLGMWFATIGYLVYLLNDIGVSEEIIDIDDVDNIDNSNIEIGDDLWEK